MTAHHVSYLANARDGFAALGVLLDKAHVKDGRWTPEEYAEQRAYKALFYELGMETSDDLFASADDGTRWDVDAWRPRPQPTPGPSVVKLRGLANRQVARAVAEALADEGFDSDTYEGV